MKGVRTSLKRLNKREQAEEDKLYHSVGRAVVIQSNVEGLLGFIFILLSGIPDRKEAEQKFLGAHSFHDRLELTTGLIEKSCTAAAKKQWKPIHTALHSYRRERNKFSHNAISRQLDSKRRFLGVYLAPHWYKRRDGDEKITPSDAKKVADAIDKTRKEIWKFIFDGMLDR